MDFLRIYFSKNEPLISWTILDHFFHHFWVVAVIKTLERHFFRLSECLSNVLIKAPTQSDEINIQEMFNFINLTINLIQDLLDTLKCLKQQNKSLKLLKWSCSWKFPHKQVNVYVLIMCRWEFSPKINKCVIGSNKACRWEKFLKENKICCMLIREFRVVLKIENLA